MSEHKMGHLQEPSTYLRILIYLFVLTIVTVAASKVHFGWEFLNVIVALVIAAFKASLVIRFFMHGKYENGETWAFIVYPIVLLVTLVGFLFLDYGFRPKDKYVVTPVAFDDQAHGEHGSSHNSTETHGEPTNDHAAAETPAETHGDSSDVANAEPAGESHAEAPAEAAANALPGDAAKGLEKAKILCIACHKVDGAGNELPGAPPFAETMANPEKTPEYLRKWLKNPAEVKPGTIMPNLGLSDSDIENLIAYLATIKN
ncbi:MAG: cytochrome C oxidase subunit IV family protein [Acidobacteria bacterium]|nr:cytochrome C oxidase subunit IV family protein [Acidobacteriota bacterium]